MHDQGNIVYVLRSDFHPDRYYTGLTDNMERRLATHNSGGSQHTSAFRPWTVVAFTTFAGLTQVPDEVLEAAQLDGAGGAKRFFFIVVPYIKSILVIVLILQVIWDLRVFTQIYALQSIGGLAEQTNTLGVYIYRVSLGSGDFGVGGAISVIVVLLLATVSVFYVRRSIKEESL